MFSNGPAEQETKALPVLGFTHVTLITFLWGSERQLLLMCDIWLEINVFNSLVRGLNKREAFFGRSVLSPGRVDGWSSRMSSKKQQPSTARTRCFNRSTPGIVPLDSSRISHAVGCHFNLVYFGFRESMNFTLWCSTGSTTHTALRMRPQKMSALPLFLSSRSKSQRTIQWWTSSFTRTQIRKMFCSTILTLQQLSTYMIFILLQACHSASSIVPGQVWSCGNSLRRDSTSKMPWQRPHSVWSNLLE